MIDKNLQDLLDIGRTNATPDATTQANLFHAEQVFESNNRTILEIKAVLDMINRSPRRDAIIAVDPVKYQQLIQSLDRLTQSQKELIRGLEELVPGSTAGFSD